MFALSAHDQIKSLGSMHFTYFISNHPRDFLVLFNMVCTPETDELGRHSVKEYEFITDIEPSISYVGTEEANAQWNSMIK